MTQLSLLSPIAVPQPAVRPELRIEIQPVPRRWAIVPGQRFYIAATLGDLLLWRSPLQLTELEAWALLPELEVLCDWTLPLHQEPIYATVESFIDDQLPASIRQELGRVQR